MYEYYVRKILLSQISHYFTREKFLFKFSTVGMYIIVIIHT